jgi:hypothetical protein
MAGLIVRGACLEVGGDGGGVDDKRVLWGRRQAQDRARPDEQRADVQRTLGRQGRARERATRFTLRSGRRRAHLALGRDVILVGGDNLLHRVQENVWQPRVAHNRVSWLRATAGVRMADGRASAPFGTGGMLMRTAPSALRAAFCAARTHEAASGARHTRGALQARTPTRLIRSEQHDAPLDGAVRLHALEDALPVVQDAGCGRQLQRAVRLQLAGRPLRAGAENQSGHQCLQRACSRRRKAAGGAPRRRAGRWRHTSPPWA